MEHTGWQDETADDEEFDALGDVMRAAENALLALTPATATGALAVLSYARELADKHNSRYSRARDRGGASGLGRAYHCRD